MKRKLIALLCLTALVLSVAGCSEKEDTTSTVTGIVVSIEGTVVTLRQFDRNTTGNSNRDNAQQRPSRDENWQRPEGDFTRPEGDFTMPEEDFTRPEVGKRPEEGQRPTMPEGERPSFGNFGDDQGETTTADLKNAHISIQDGDIKAAGSIDDIKAGSFLTVTVNSKGEATEVLVASMRGFGGSRGQGSFSGSKGNRGNKNSDSNE